MSVEVFRYEKVAHLKHSMHGTPSADMANKTFKTLATSEILMEEWLKGTLKLEICEADNEKLVLKSHGIKDMARYIREYFAISLELKEVLVAIEIQSVVQEARESAQKIVDDIVEVFSRDYR